MGDRSGTPLHGRVVFSFDHSDSERTIRGWIEESTLSAALHIVGTTRSAAGEAGINSGPPLAVLSVEEANALRHTLLRMAEILDEAEGETAQARAAALGIAEAEAREMLRREWLDDPVARRYPDLIRFLQEDTAETQSPREDQT